MIYNGRTCFSLWLSLVIGFADRRFRGIFLDVLESEEPSAVGKSSYSLDIVYMQMSDMDMDNVLELSLCRRITLTLTFFGDRRS